MPESVEPPVGEGEYDHLILWMLSLVPTQRLEVLQGFVDGDVRFRSRLVAGAGSGNGYPSSVPGPAEIVGLAAASLTDVPASDLGLLTRKLREPER